MNTAVLILVSVFVVGLCVFGLCFNIIFRKNGQFPDSEVGHNKELRKRGVICMREEDERIWGKSAHLQITGNHSNRKNRGRIKNSPDTECLSCNQVCSLKALFEKQNEQRDLQCENELIKR